MENEKNNKRNEENKRDMNDFFNYFFNNPADIFQAFEERFQRLQQEMSRFDQWSEKSDQYEKSDNKPRIYGWSYYQGPDGIPHYQKYTNENNIPMQKKPKLTAEKNEPFIDLIESEKEVFITVELPGINKENIDVELNKNYLFLDVKHPDRGFSKEINLPTEVAKKPIKAKYNNGVLSITLQKKKGKKKGNKIDIQ